MWRATWKAVLARRLRLVLTATAVVLGVAFVTGTLVLTDTTREQVKGIVGALGSSVAVVRAVESGSSACTSASAPG